MNLSISRDDLKNLIDSGKTPIIVEALPMEYYEAEHLPGAINIPHDEIQAKAAQVISDKSAAVLCTARVPSVKTRIWRQSR